MKRLHEATLNSHTAFLIIFRGSFSPFILRTYSIVNFLVKFIYEYFYYYFSTVVPFNTCIFSCRPFAVITTFSTDPVWCPSFFCLLALTVEILLNIIFHALMERFQLELFIFITYFSTVVPLTNCFFLSCRPFVVNATFSTGLVGVEVTSVS